MKAVFEFRIYTHNGRGKNTLTAATAFTGTLLYVRGGRRTECVCQKYRNRVSFSNEKRTGHGAAAITHRYSLRCVYKSKIRNTRNSSRLASAVERVRGRFAARPPVRRRGVEVTYTPL